MRLESFLRRCVKLGYVERSFTVAGLFSEANVALFRRIPYNKTHVLHTYLPERPQIVTPSVLKLITSLSLAKLVT